MEEIVVTVEEHILHPGRCHEGAGASPRPGPESTPAAMEVASSPAQAPTRLDPVIAVGRIDPSPAQVVPAAPHALLPPAHPLLQQNIPCTVNSVTSGRSQRPQDSDLHTRTERIFSHSSPSLSQLDHLLFKALLPFSGTSKALQPVSGAKILTPRKSSPALPNSFLQRHIQRASPG